MVGFELGNIWVNEFSILANGTNLYMAGEGCREAKKEEWSLRIAWLNL